MPKIDLTAIPGLQTAQGLFGSLNSDEGEGGSSDPIVDIMVFLYETAPPPPPEMFF